MAVSTIAASSLVAGKQGVEDMAEETVEFVVASDCLVDGEVFLAGESRSVTKSVHRALMAAGRVCKDPEIAASLKERRARALELEAGSAEGAAQTAAAETAAAKAAAEEAAREAAAKAASEAKAKAKG